jgi:large exoprotein involved in heme utilization and adhesion
MKVYPNPTHGTFVLETTAPVHNGRLQMFSADGSRVMEKDLSSGNQWTVNHSGLKPGIYILQLVTDKQVRKMKLVVN